MTGNATFDNADFHNVAANSVDGGLIGILVVVALVFIATAMIAEVYRHARGLERVLRVLRALKRSLKLAIMGLPAALFGGILYGLTQAYLSAQPTTRSLLHRYALYALAAFTGLVVLGWLTERFLERVEQHVDELTDELDEPAWNAADTLEGT